MSKKKQKKAVKSIIEPFVKRLAEGKSDTWEECKKLIQELSGFTQSQSALKEAFPMDESAIEGAYCHAYNFYQHGHYETSSFLLRLLTTWDPNDYRFIFALATNQHLLKDYRAAIQNYLKAVDLQPNQALPYFHLADCYQQLNELKPALSSYESCVAIAGEQEEYASIVNRCEMAIKGLRKK